MAVVNTEVRFNGAITLADSEPEPDITIAKLPESRFDKITRRIMLKND